MKDKIFGVLQRVGRSFMLPIALLPVAGLLLGIGSSFTNETMLAAYGLNNVIHPGTLIYTILDVMSQTGNAVFNNLALLFAMGVAIGMARKEKEVAALSGAVAYIIMNTAIQAMINAAGGVEAMPANSTTTMLGITTLQMGVFGGIVVGLGVAALHNKFYKIELPQVLAFFGGTRFVPIISSIVYLVVGIAMFYIWPVVQNGIAALGALVLASGYAGTFIYGLLERALIPFGLHHVFYMPFWQTAVGGTAIIDGVTVTGAQNIFFAELASKSTTVFSVSATRFMAGKFPFMMFGLPGAALATAVSPVLSIAICSRHFFKKSSTVRLVRQLPSPKLLAQTCQLGVSGFVGEMSSGVTTTVFNLLLLRLAGNVAVAAYGVVANYALVATAIFNGVAQGAQPLVSRCYGKNDAAGARKLLLLGSGTALALAAALYAVLFGFTGPIVAVFNSENSALMAQYAFSGMRIYFLGYFFAGFNIVAAGYLGAVDRPAEASATSLSRGIVAIVACSLVLSALFGMNGVWAAFPASEAITACLTLFLLKRKKRTA